MIFAAAVVVSLFGPGLAEREHPVHAAKIEKIVRAAIESQQAPGVAVAILEKGKLTHAKGYGFAELEHEVPMRADSICRIASVTKQFTAAGILRLAERGKISLDDPFGKYVDGFGEIGNKATIRHLLQHTSGVADFTRLGAEWFAIDQLERTPDQLMDLVRGKPLDFEPGTKWSYDNTGYVLLGMVIEKATGTSYGEFLENDLLDGLELHDTRYGDDGRIMKRRAQGYRRENGVVLNDELKSMSQPHAAGAIVSTVVDLVRWSEALAAGKVVSSESYAEMSTVGTLTNNEKTNYGYGLVIGDLAGKPMIWHNGGIHGFSSRLARYIGEDVHIAVLVNCDYVSTDRVETSIAKALFGIPEEEVKDLPLSEEEIEACTGKFEYSETSIVIRTDGETLTIIPPGKQPARLKSQGDLRFYADAPVEVIVEFDREANPAGHFTLKQGGRSTKFTRVK